MAIHVNQGFSAELRRQSAKGVIQLKWQHSGRNYLSLLYYWLVVYSLTV